MNDMIKEIGACKNALTAVEFALQSYGSAPPAHEIIERVIASLESGAGGPLGKDLAVAIQRMGVAPAKRSSFQLGE